MLGATSSYRRYTALLLGFALAVGYGLPLARMVVEAFRLRPIGRMDATGLEGAFGRLTWRDINSITVQWRWTRLGGHRRVVLAADPTKVKPATVSWSRFLVPDAEAGIALPLWGRRESVLNELRRWYDGPIDR